MPNIVQQAEKSNPILQYKQVKKEIIVSALTLAMTSPPVAPQLVAAATQPLYVVQQNRKSIEGKGHLKWCVSCACLGTQNPPYAQAKQPVGIIWH